VGDENLKTMDQLTGRPNAVLCRILKYATVSLITCLLIACGWYMLGCPQQSSGFATFVWLLEPSWSSAFSGAFCTYCRRLTKSFGLAAMNSTTARYRDIMTIISEPILIVIFSFAWATCFFVGLTYGCSASSDTNADAKRAKFTHRIKVAKQQVRCRETEERIHGTYDNKMVVLFKNGSHELTRMISLVVAPLPYLQMQVFGHKDEMQLTFIHVAQGTIEWMPSICTESSAERQIVRNNQSHFNVSRENRRFLEEDAALSTIHTTPPVRNEGSPVTACAWLVEVSMGYTNYTSAVDIYNTAMYWAAATMTSTGTIKRMSSITVSSVESFQARYFFCGRLLPRNPLAPICQRLRFDRSDLSNMPNHIHEMGQRLCTTMASQRILAERHIARNNHSHFNVSRENRRFLEEDAALSTIRTTPPARNEESPVTACVWLVEVSSEFRRQCVFHIEYTNYTSAVDIYNTAMYWAAATMTSTGQVNAVAVLIHNAPLNQVEVYVGVVWRTYQGGAIPGCQILMGDMPSCRINGQPQLENSYGATKEGDLCDIYGEVRRGNRPKITGEPKNSSGFCLNPLAEEFMPSKLNPLAKEYEPTRTAPTTAPIIGPVGYWPAPPGQPDTGYWLVFV